MSYTCPKCGRTSQHPDDEANRYCGHCNEFEQYGVHILTVDEVMELLNWREGELPSAPASDPDPTP